MLVGTIGEMIHVIPDSEIERLALVAGVTNFEDWQRQHLEAQQKIDQSISDDIEDSWNACFPVWREFGRVKDLSEAVRVPKYWPSFATNLGRAFANRFHDEYGFLVGLLEQTPINSVEYLCACDVLLFIVDACVDRQIVVPTQLFLLSNPLSPVIERELRWEDDAPQNVGQMLRWYFDRNHSDGIGSQ